MAQVVRACAVSVGGVEPLVLALRCCAALGRRLQQRALGGDALLSAAHAVAAVNVLFWAQQCVDCELAATRPEHAAVVRTLHVCLYKHICRNPTSPIRNFFIADATPSTASRIMCRTLHHVTLPASHGHPSRSFEYRVSADSNPRPPPHSSSRR